MTRVTSAPHPHFRISGRVVENTGRPFSFSHARSRNKKAIPGVPRQLRTYKYSVSTARKNGKETNQRSSQNGAQRSSFRGTPKVAGQAVTFGPQRAGPAFSLTVHTGAGRARVSVWIDKRRSAFGDTCCDGLDLIWFSVELDL